MIFFLWFLHLYEVQVFSQGPVLSAHKKLVAEKLAEEEEAERKVKGDAKKEKHVVFYFTSNQFFVLFMVQHALLFSLRLSHSQNLCLHKCIYK